MITIHKGRIPYWIKLKPLFKKYGVTLKMEPYEDEVKKVIEGWLKDHDIISKKRRGFGIDIPDYEISWNGYNFGIEVKGHSDGRQRTIPKILNQIERYIKLEDFLIVIVHSIALKTHIKSHIEYCPQALKRRILLIQIAEINNLPSKMTELEENNQAYRRIKTVKVSIQTRNTMAEKPYVR